MLAVGIVGLPNSGKSTLFNALLKRQIADVAEYPFTTIEPNVGVVEVPDERLDTIAKLTGIAKIVPAAIEFIDIAGLVKGANLGEGLGNQFLAKIREVDAILHIIRAFENLQVAHVHGKIDPKYDVEIVNLELELAGITKPTLYILNVSEAYFGKAQASFSGIEAVPICARLEAEIGALEPEEQKAYWQELGVTGSSLDRIISAAYKLLDLITFFTITGGKQVQAWPIRKGATVIEAAEMVHTDFAKNFIKAEVINFADFAKLGGEQQAKVAGKVKIAGRDYEVGDGDIIRIVASA